MANIGNLSFGIGGDDKELRKILDDRKKDAIELQKLLSSFNVGGKQNSNRQQMNDIVKLTEQRNRLEQSNLRLQETRDRVAANSLISQQRVNQATERTNALNLQSLRVDADRLAAEQRIRTETERTEAVRRRQQVSAAQLARIEQDRINNERLAQQRLLTEIQRTEAARQRAAMIGLQGQNSLNGALGLTNRTMFNQRILLSDLSRQLGIYFSIYQVGAFVKELAMVSGEFEKQRLSLTAMLQDKEAADRIFGQIKDLAVYSPFNFKQLTDYAKQLSAYSIPADELYDTMKRLADVSAGLGVDMNRIVLAFGQIRASSILKGTELRQLAETGLPIVDMLIKKFKELGEETVTAGDIFDKISNKEVPFTMIKEIFQDLTNEGGMFFQMQEIQATSLAGKISNLRDSFDIMLDSIGSANSDLLKGSVDGLVNLMNNWEKYWNILKGIIITYGAYKAAVIVATTGVQVLASAQKAYNLLMLSAAIQGNKLGAVIDLLTLKFNNLSKATKIGLALSAIVALGYALKSAYDNAHELENALKDIAGKVKGDADASVAAMDLLLIRLKHTNKYSKEYRDIIDEINKKYGEFLPNLIKESETYDQIAAKLKNVTAAIYEKAKAQAYSQSLEKLETNLSENISKAYKSAMESLTEKPLMGFGQYVLSKDQANKVVADMFAAIRNSPELYRQEREVEKLISDSMAKAYAAAGKGNSVKTSFADLYNITQLDGMIKGVKSYAEEFTMLPEIQKAYFNEIEASYGANVNYANSIEQIQQKYEKLNAELDKKPFKDKGEFDTAKLENHKNMLLEMIAAYKDFGQYKLAENVQKQYDELAKANEGWRVELKNILGNTLTITAETNFNEVVKDIKDKYKEVKERIEAQKPILMEMGLDFKTMAFPSPMNVSPSRQQMLNGYKKDTDDLNNLNKAIEAIGLNTSDWIKTKGGSSKKDRFTEGLKDKIELIKEAKSQYEELQTVMSKPDAFGKISSIQGYKEVKQTDISKEGYKDYLRGKIKEIEKHFGSKKLTDAAKSLVESLNKELNALDFKDITENAKKEIDKIEKFLSRYKEKYSTYKQLSEITGDKGKAAELVFGDSSMPIKNHIDMMKDKLKELSGGGIYEDLLKVDPATLTEPVHKMVEDISDAIQEQDFALKIDLSKMIADYATTEEKITSIHNQYETKREEARKSGASEDVINRSVAAYDKAEADAVAELREELWQLTPFYRQLFGELSDISYRHLKKMVSDAKETVTQIANTKNEDGSLKYGKYDERGKLEGYYMPNQDGSKSDVLINLRQYERIITRIASVQKDMRKENPFDSLLRPSSEYKVAEGTSDEKQMPFLDIMGSKAADLNAIVQDVGGSLSGMFDALGNEDAADATAFIGEMVGAVSNVAMGIASGNPIQVIQGIIGGITAIAKNHDAKLDKAIKKSQTQVKYLKNEYSELQRVVERQLGAISSSQAKQQVQNLEKQKKELQSQRQNEIDKKKTDWNTVADYENQISEIKDQIRYFYEDLAGEQFGIKIKDWAKNISDALVEAWSKGEDAAKAFDDTVADIMRNVFKNVLQLQYVEPMMQQLRTYMFGTDGKGGILGDGDLSKSDMNGLVQELTKLKGNLSNWQSAWDYLCEAAKQAGIDLEEKVSDSDTLSKGIQAVTEDTANLLASYINAMRADLSLQKSMVERIMLYAERNNDTFALMQADIMRIQINTLAIATNTNRLVEISEDTNSLLRRASTSGSGVKFNIN
ncbi:hypothetical protein CLV62_104133 [Dysgonomonas alginatilytica]|uniref:Tape measure protein N-terminal domain-containing protein n=1 Tax=Dysgonomonas alginatilytica TaxID=1605892 RepID=A0A2V3PYK8_9BACT|nr:tape measure protein [Dysgonomonas alginatilytica]PXV66872.1 hypothetical protein CLV62_104133 [Dysgonomonas alginatilytica]